MTDRGRVWPIEMPLHVMWRNSSARYIAAVSAPAQCVVSLLLPAS